MRLAPMEQELSTSAHDLLPDVLDICDCDLTEATALAEAFGTTRYGYVVTANVDHAIRYYYQPDFRDLYSSATYVLLDSRFLGHVLRLLKRQHLRVCPGSDLTRTLFEATIKPRDAVLMVGGTAQQAQKLREHYGLKALRHIDPPMNLMNDAAAIEACVSEIEAASPFRFCFIVLGSPLQEIIAGKLKERGIARGLAFCVGASINYMTGVELRAPPWMQRIGFEWLFRLLQQPRRMAHRYLIRGPRIFWLALRIELRPRRPMDLSRAEAIYSGPVASGIIGNCSDPLDASENLKAASLP